MKLPEVYSAFAVLLPVALGLGLLYLAIVGRLEPSSALAGALGLAAAAGLGIFVRDFASDCRVLEGGRTRR